MTLDYRAATAQRVSAGFVVTLLLLTAWPAHAQTPTDFGALQPDQRVYDRTGYSLTESQVGDLRQRLLGLQSVGADVILLVRALDATAEETLDQVEALQQAWVAATGTDQDTAVAILINRNPDHPNDARAGIFVGRAFDDGNVPQDEQLAIVDEALIPPLRDGDVHGSFTHGLTRLDTSIRNGPPVSALEVWAHDAGGSWLLWLVVALTAVAATMALAVFSRRQRTARPDPMPTTRRPANLPPALGGALAKNGPQNSAVPATLLDLAGRGGIAIESESTGSTFSEPSVQVRLLDAGMVDGPIDAALWADLEKRSEEGVVSSKRLTKLAAASQPVRQAVEAELRSRDWWDPEAARNKVHLGIIVALSVVLLAFGIIVAGVGGQPLMLVGIVPLAALVIGIVAMIFLYSNLSLTGQQAAQAWRGYHDGLKAAAKDKAAPLDLDGILPDAVAMNLGASLQSRMKEANEAGLPLRAFSGTDMSTFPWWIAFNSSVTSSSGGSSVSGGGAGGGGGAAGST